VVLVRHNARIEAEKLAALFHQAVE